MVFDAEDGQLIGFDASASAKNSSEYYRFG
jgi:hypothetical protein